VTSAENDQQGDGKAAPASEATDQEPTPDKGADSRRSVSAHWRVIVAGVVEVAGIGVLSAGFWLIRPWAGLIVLGVGLIVMGVASSPRFDRRRPPP
jgi:hypothetical protein